MIISKTAKCKYKMKKNQLPMLLARVILLVMHKVWLKCTYMEDTIFFIHIMYLYKEQIYTENTLLFPSILMSGKQGLQACQGSAELDIDYPLFLCLFCSATQMHIKIKGRDLFIDSLPYIQIFHPCCEKPYES